MVSNKYLQLVLFNTCMFALGLEVNLSAKDNITWSGSNIMQTVTSIQKITNDIFSALKLKNSKSNERLKQYAVTFNYFSSITSKDDENLHQISIASRVDHTIGNVSRDLVDVINEILNEEPGNSTEESKDDNLQIYVDEFLKNLEYLKNSNGVNNINYDIDNQILQLMRSDEHNNVTNKDPDVDDDYDDSSDNEFWRPGDNTRRIYKGENTKVRYFPFMASIHIFKNFQCGGSIIKSDLIITAASCLQLAYNNRFFRENPAFLSVRIGSNYYVGGGETLAVLEVYFYPTYDPKSLNNNVAIMRLERRINFKTGISRAKKIEYDSNAHGLPLSGIDDGITIIGWGAKGLSNVVRDPWNNRLSFAVLDVYPLRECQEIYSKKYVTQKTFCAGFFSKGSGACSGDVGGPGVVAGVLAGIISFGSPRCGTPDAPTVFTKVGYYADWIEEIMEQDVPVHNLKTTTLAPRTFYTPPPNQQKSTYVMLPIFDKDFLPAAINQVRSDPKQYQPLRSGTKKSRPKKDDLDNEEDHLFKEFLAVMFGSNEVGDYEKMLDKGKEAKREHVKKMRKKKRITTTPAYESDENSDDKEQRKATRSYKPTAIVDEFKHASNEVPLFDDHDVVGADTPADGDKLDDNLELDGDILEDNILKLIEGLDMNSETEIDKIVAQISDEPLNLETVEDDSKKLRKKNKLKSSRKDKNSVDNVDMQYESVDNDEILKIIDHDTLDESRNQETSEVDSKKRRKKNKLKSSRKEKDTLDNVDEKYESVDNDESLNQETSEDDSKKRRKKNKLKSSRKDKETLDNVDVQDDSVDNDEIFEINDHDTLDDGVSVNTEFEDLTLREKKNNNNEKGKVQEADSIFDLLPKEDMYQLLAQAVDEITQTGFQEHQ